MIYILHVWNVFDGHYQFFRLNFGFFNVCESFIPDFQNLHYLLHLNESAMTQTRQKSLKMTVPKINLKCKK